MLPPGAIFERKIHQNAYAVGASPRTPLGEITELPRPLANFLGSRFAAGERSGNGEQEKEEKGRGIVFPTSFLQFNHCSA